MTELNDRVSKILTDSTHIADAMSQSVIDGAVTGATGRSVSESMRPIVAQQVTLNEATMQRLGDLLQQSFESERIDSIHSYDGTTYCEISCWGAF
ncbi:Hypothetical protein GLP15_2537 [Giardia lamblia P15]|uniref:Uncharacterized protein n=1 Tax=Giardia intestinalis (strain P15) TaxID=658858 RepID=E1EXD3_GIAIA|nr:Hypothetical protein GLP15_2537 [Giardia lamblia P15]